MTEYHKPLPQVDDFSRPFWESCRLGRLVAQRCDDCDHVWWPPGPVCTHCLSRQFRWEELSGRGEVWSWIIYHHVFHAAFASDVPYNVALVKLEEGPTMVSSIVTKDNVVINDASLLRVGMKVVVSFDPVTEDVSIPRFVPLDDEHR